MKLLNVDFSNEKFHCWKKKTATKRENAAIERLKNFPAKQLTVALDDIKCFLFFPNAHAQTKTLRGII